MQTRHENGEPKSLPILQANGAQAYVEGAAWEPVGDDPTEVQLWYVSLVGAREAVKALWAHLVGRGVGSMAQEAFGRAIYPRLAHQEPGSWSWKMAALPRSAAWHGLLLPRIADHRAERLEFLLLVPEGEEPSGLYYRYLNRRVDLPLLPSWGGWLVGRARERGELRELPGYGQRAAYLCRTDVDSLRADVSEAVRIGELGEEQGTATLPSAA